MKISITINIYDEAGLEPYQLQDKLEENLSLFEAGVEMAIRSATLAPISGVRVAYSDNHPDDIQDSYPLISCK